MSFLLGLPSGGAVAQTPPEAIATDPRFTTFSAAIDAAGFADEMNEAPLTVFAPTDEAFARLPEAVADGVTAPNNAGATRELLSLHMVADGPVRGRRHPRRDADPVRGAHGRDLHAGRGAS